MRTEMRTLDACVNSREIKADICTLYLFTVAQYYQTALC